MRTVLLSLAILYSAQIYAQTSKQGNHHEMSDDDEGLAIVEIGGAASWDIKGLALSGGPSLAVEFTPIKDWLEIELGSTEYYSKGVSELSFDLLFKKPYTISRRVEFMAGIGPEFSSVRSGGHTTNIWAGEFGLDLMYWPFKKQKFGFFAEPAYDYSFSAGNEQSIGATAGLLVSIK